MSEIMDKKEMNKEKKISTENETDTEKAEKAGKADGIENTKNTVLPLINSLFLPGHAREIQWRTKFKSFIYFFITSRLWSRKQE